MMITKSSSFCLLTAVFFAPELVKNAKSALAMHHLTLNCVSGLSLNSTLMMKHQTVSAQASMPKKCSLIFSSNLQCFSAVAFSSLLYSEVPFERNPCCQRCQTGTYSLSLKPLKHLHQQQHHQSLPKVIRCSQWKFTTTITTSH